ncbi:TldD/PmbA family protein [Streptomyces sp. AM 4-1-1]|uniref:TldD/PmbA family protein n=1 Tax=Streptomyces sp. AM 4-1-1 TaxID=3028710 RepID=UPI0023B9AEAC|nr:TldD/PmbA family protein [Streptomyces sp. AM 4-1-1]WEH37180.1 TldD/PmbA family protein [Streptomyces sp. AM 4-1-1]
MTPRPGPHSWGETADPRTADALLEAALDAATGPGVDHADVRLVECEELRLYAHHGAAPDERVEHNLGIGVRVLLDGAWGFAGLPLGDHTTAREAAHRAVANATEAARVNTERVTLPARTAVTGRFSTPVRTDPFAVPAQERYALLDAVLAAATAPARVVSAQAGFNAKRQHRHFADTEGSRQHQDFTESGAMLMAFAADRGQVQRRSYPNSFHGNTAAAGWEYVRSLDLVEEAARVGDEAVALLTAPTADPGIADLVIGPAQMSLQIHESCGHALELDRILGDEANYAGTSFITKDAIGALRYGSEAVDITADPTLPGTRGTFAFDDEGTPAARRPLVTRGVVRDFLSHRDSAARIGRAPIGAARSDGWAYPPVCFATNVFLEPGRGSTGELLERLGDGYLIDDNRSWSIDERRLNFQFGTEVAYEVRNGRKGRLLRDFSYGGTTPQFWGSVEAVAGPEEFKAFGMPCGKGEPKQWGFLGHGAAPTLVRGVRIGVA